MYTIPIDINIPAWNEWIEYRAKGKKKKVTAFAAKKQFKLLLKYSEEDQQRVIDNSIMNDYQGLFDIKPTYQPPQQSGMTMLTDTSWADGMTNEKTIGEEHGRITGG